MDLILPDATALRPFEECAGLLLLGQGFATRAEFLVLARTVVGRLTRVAPFDTLISKGSNYGKLTVLADPTIGVDLGVTAATPPRPRALALAGTGSQLETALDALTVPRISGLSTSTTKASSYWRLSHFGGSRTKLVAIVRKPPAGAAPGEYYSLPIVAVDVDPTRDWWRLILRGLSQSLAGLGDEFVRGGADWLAPPAGWVVDPQQPTAPPLAHRLGRNTIVFNQVQRAMLGTSELADIFPDALDTAWVDRHFSGNTPYRPASGPVVGADPEATISVAEGGAGFRTGVLHCDRPCVMAQVPAEPLSTVAPPSGDPVGSPPIDLCPVCEALVGRALGTGWTTTDSEPRHLDNQVSHYDRAQFGSRTLVAAPFTTPTTVSETMSRGVTWRFSIGVEATGLVIRDLKLAARPGDPMASSEDVAESITFTDIAYDQGTGRQTLDVADALANTKRPPVLEVGRNPNGMLRVGTRLTLHWEPEDGLVIRADASLTCRDIAFDFDPGGAAEACKFYPELVLTWTRANWSVRQVRRLHGCVTIVANNRITDLGHGHSGMVANSQSVMLLTDSNNSREDADYDLDLGVGEASLLGVPVAVPVTAAWRSGRLLGGMDKTEKLAAYQAWKFGVQPLLPEWSWLFDYGRAVAVGPHEVLEVVCWEDTDGARGARTRSITKPWPPMPDPALGSPPPAITVLKTPRQGAFDSIHLNADMGVDDRNRPVVAAPFCADVCLHLHVRWGIHAVAAGKDYPPFRGWSSGTHAYSHSTLGAPLVPPNQRISFGITRPDTSRTKIRYIAEIAWPTQGKRQVVLEQGLGFAFSYSGLDFTARNLLNAVYGPGQSAGTRIGFLRGTDASVRAFFRGIYEQIRFLSYGYPALLTAPQQIPTDAFRDPESVSQLLFFELVDL